MRVRKLSLSLLVDQSLTVPEMPAYIQVGCLVELILKTDPDYTTTFIRIVAGVIIFPYGQQKLLGWWDDFGGGVGIRESLEQFKRKNIPAGVALLVILSQSFGSIALILGFGGRLAAAANFIIFTAALIHHLPGGWVMNWTGKKRGEGV